MDTPPTFTHPYPYAAGVECDMCKPRGGGPYPASHKVAEVTEDYRHEFTAYVCCRHFTMIMGSVAARACASA